MDAAACLERARELAREAFVMDAHFDLGVDMDDRRERGARRVWSDRHDAAMRAGGVNCVVAAIFIHSSQLPEMGLRKAMDQIAALAEEACEQPDKIALCDSMSAAEAASGEGRVSILISLEGLDPIGNDLSLLRAFYRLGVRAAGLTWSRRNYAADGCFFAPRDCGTMGGLTDFGVAAVREMERLGMLVDISHLNDAGTADVIKIASKPFIASHSNARAVTDVARNLTDAQLKAVAESGGVVGMNGCSAFVSSERRPGIGARELCDHIDYITKLIGDDHVGLGLDLCDGLANFSGEPPSIETYDVIPSHSMVPDLAAEMLSRGRSEDSVVKILGANFRRVWAAITG